MNTIEVLKALDTTPLEDYKYGNLVVNYVNALLPEDTPVAGHLTGRQVLEVIQGLPDRVRIKLYEMELPEVVVDGTPITQEDLKEMAEDPETIPKYNRSYLNLIAITITAVVLFVVAMALLIGVQTSDGQMDGEVVKGLGDVLVELVKLITGMG